MRLSAERDGWHADGVIRRDFRHTHDGPEVPRRAKNRRKNIKGCLAKGHSTCEVEVFVWRTDNFPYVDEQGRAVIRRREHLAARCGNCKRRDVDPSLLAGVVDVVDPGQRSRFLASYWCTNGHLYQQDEYVRGGYGRGRSLKRVWCVMCGRIRQGYSLYSHINDVALYTGAGVTLEVALAVVEARTRASRDEIVYPERAAA